MATPIRPGPVFWGFDPPKGKEYHDIPTQTTDENETDPTTDDLALQLRELCLLTIIKDAETFEGSDLRSKVAELETQWKDNLRQEGSLIGEAIQKIESLPEDQRRDTDVQALQRLRLLKAELEQEETQVQE